MTMKSWILTAIAVLASSPAAAFHEVESFDRSAVTGGGNGSYFTGSPREKGYDCRICHVGAEGRISVELGGDLTSGRYEPGLIYRIDVKLVGEHRGLESAFNPNTFTADVTRPTGQTVGRLATSSGSIVELVDDGQVAVAEGFGNGESEWSFSWWAPEEGTPATLHIALLDGDGASEPVRRFIDPLNDDVATAKLSLCPVGMECAPPAPPAEETSPAGCRAAGGRFSPSSWLFVGLLCILGFVRGHRRIARD